MPPIVPSEHPPVVLCIAGFDPSGGAGLIADSRACAAMHTHAICVQTALVPQNTQGVRAIEAISPEMVRLQAQTLLDDMPVSAIKIGLLPNFEVLQAVLEIVTPLVKEKSVPLIIDPVLAPSTGPAFTDDEVAKAIIENLFPLAAMITPNTVEATRLTGIETHDLQSMEHAARALRKHAHSGSVLIKGGHLAPIEARRRVDRLSSQSQETSALVVDLFFDGKNVRELRSPRVEGIEVRGTGCLLASAIAAQMANGVAPFDSARLAKNWITKQIEKAHTLGQGRRIAAF